MSKYSELSVTLLKFKFFQYINDEKFCCFSAKHNDDFKLDVLVSVYENREVGDSLLLKGFLRTDLGYQRRLKLRFFAVNTAEYHGKPVNIMYVHGVTNKLTTMMTLANGKVVRDIVIRLVDQKHANILRLNLVNKAARQSTNLKLDTWISGTGVLIYRQMLEVELKEYEEVS